MSPKVGDWAASPCCPHPSTPSVRPSLLHPLTSSFQLQQPLWPSVRPSRSFPLPSSLLSPPCRPLSLSRRARLQPSHPCRCSRPSSWLGRPSPWHLGCGIPGTGICRGGGAGAAGAGRWERPWEVKDSRQGMSIVHHRSWPGLTAPLGSGGGGGPGRALRLLGPGPGGSRTGHWSHTQLCTLAWGLAAAGERWWQRWGVALRLAGALLAWVTPGMGILRGGHLPGQASHWDGHPTGVSTPLGWVFPWDKHPTGVGIALGQASL